MTLDEASFAQEDYFDKADRQLEADIDAFHPMRCFGIHAAHDAIEQRVDDEHVLNWETIDLRYDTEDDLDARHAWRGIAESRNVTRKVAGFGCRGNAALLMRERLVVQEYMDDLVVECVELLGGGGYNPFLHVEWVAA